MPKLLVIGVVGLFAQLIDGALGMSYGVTTTTLLLTAGVAPAVASATVHLAEIGTTLASGTAHWKFGNVEWPVVLEDGGARVHRRIRGRSAALVAFGRGGGSGRLRNPDRHRDLRPLLQVRQELAEPRSGQRSPGNDPHHLPRAARPVRRRDGCDGGWGLGSDRDPDAAAPIYMELRKVVGSIDTSEFLVAIGASLGFLVGLGGEAINYGWVGAILVGGLIAAPLAAWIVKHLPPGVLGLSVGTLIIVTNSQTIADAAGIDEDLLSGVSVAFGVAWIAAVATLLLRGRRTPPVPARA